MRAVLGSSRAWPLVLFIVLCRTGPAAAQEPADGPWTLTFQSQPGDFIGEGEAHTYTDTQAGNSLTIRGTANTVTGRLQEASFSARWDFAFSAPVGTALVPGDYRTAHGYAVATQNGLSFSGHGRGCNVLTGWFVVLEAQYAPGGAVVRFAADFEQHCDGVDAALFGSIRFHSSLDPAPFAGQFPSLSLTVPTPVHGTVTSSGTITCGTGGASCVDVLAAAASVTLTATPDSGYLLAGWTGDCRGGLVTTVRVNGPKQCGALFEAIDPPGPRTLIAIESRAGDPAGRGSTQIFSSGNSTITARIQPDGSVLRFDVRSEDAASEISIQIVVGGAHGAALQPGTYESAKSFSAGLRPLVSVFGSCTASGRFLVRELVVDAAGVLVRAAVDVEQHCGDKDPALFAALRYNSTIVDPVPFEGAYPVYRLSLTPPVNGTITGVVHGIDGPTILNCGGGATACQRTPSSPESIDLFAVADPGYLFAGWTGSCSGGAAITVRVNTSKPCTAVFEPLVTAAVPRTRALFDLPPNKLGPGSPAQRQVFGSGASEWTVTLSADRRLLHATIAYIDVGGGPSSLGLDFAAPQDQPLIAGVMYPSVAYLGRAAPSMDAFNACYVSTGRFLVRELGVTSDGRVERAAVDFEEHCGDGDAAVFGTLRYNSSAGALPFDGDYPRYGLAVARPGHGRVTGSGLDCGGGGEACRLDLSAPTNVTISATPDPGYLLAGWTGSCHGGETIIVRINTLAPCDPVFETIAESGPRKMVRLVSQPGEKLLNGRTEIYSAANSVWWVFATPAGDRLDFTISGRIDAREELWSFMFRPPSGGRLAPGTYANATNSFNPAQPTLWVSVPGETCTVVGSTFTIHELLLDGHGGAARAAIDFEVHCGSAESLPLLGSIRYAADVPSAVSVDKLALVFAAVKSADGTLISTTAPQNVQVSMRSGGSSWWRAQASAPWLKVVPLSGSGSQPISISVQPSGDATGRLEGSVTVIADAGGVATLAVTLTVLPAITSPPFGIFETPVSMTQNLSGAVPLTGWALDDLEVTEVQIWRQAHTSEPPAAIFQGPGPAHGKVFIGNATLIDGARPDVEAAYPLPYGSRAGWGYMMLTRGMVWDGQGLFTLYAIALDREGHAAQIGSTVVSIDNALSTQPFGTIDTPGQGATASGLYGNTGWVMSPDLTHATTIPAENVRVMIDGVFLTDVPGIGDRPDITSTFAGMDTSHAARGLFIDTRTYTDGMHTIAWIVTDTAGHTEGIGSRFFRIANGGAGSLVAAEHAAARPAANVSADSVDEAPAAMSAIEVRHGFDPTTPFETIQGSSDPFGVELEELDRLEVKLTAVRGVRYGGYLRALGELRPLPAGAALDPATGTFTWQPPAGFLGNYDFVFVATGTNGMLSRHEVRVTIRPRSQ